MRHCQKKEKKSDVTISIKLMTNHEPFILLHYILLYYINK